MDNEKIKFLDMFRLVISWLVLIPAIYFIVEPFIVLIHASQSEDSAFNGLAFLFTIGGLILAVPGIMGVNRYKKTHKIPLSERKFSVLGLLTSIILLFPVLGPIYFHNTASLILLLFAIPGIAYLTCDIIENKLRKKAKTNFEDKTISNTTNTANEVAQMFCTNCGKQITDKEDKFCKYCGKKIVK